ncbi:MAG: Xylose isomerase domain protein barrel [Planctomycetaceae bacterium]|nr:Xylose isomerase domain protein barrel [Planctomycetaceae bacterium]
MKYGMNLLLWTTEVTDAHGPILEMLAKQGYDGVEIPVFELDAGKFKALGQRLDGLGLARTAVTVCTAEANPIGDTAAIRQAGLDHIKKAVDMCQAMGATHLCGPIHSALGVFSGQGPTADEWSRGKDILAKAADHAQKAGVTLVVEYLNRFETYFLTSAADTTRFIQEVNHPFLRTMYDTFHANIEEKDLAQAIRTITPVMAHVHISENDRSTPGEGHVDWATTFKTLKEVKYDGWMVVEAFGLALPALAAATKIWRKMFPSEEVLAANALKFMKANVEG